MTSRQRRERGTVVKMFYTINEAVVRNNAVRQALILQTRPVRKERYIIVLFHLKKWREDAVFAITFGNGPASKI